MDVKNIVQPEITLARAYLLMQLLKLDHLPVYENNQLRGIIKNIDVQRALRECSHPGKKKTVRYYMSSLVDHVDSKATLLDLVQAFLERPVEAVAIAWPEKHFHTITKSTLLRLIAQNSETIPDLLKKEVREFLENQENEEKEFA